MQKLFESIAGLFGRTKVRQDSPTGPTQHETSAPSSQLQTTPKDANDQELVSTDPRRTSEAINCIFPADIGISDEYQKLILERATKGGGGVLREGYPEDARPDLSAIVDRNVLSRELLWASRRDENKAIRVKIEDEAARLLEINMRMCDAVHIHFPSDHLRILYSKRKDWENAARVMDTERELLDSALQLPRDQDYQDERRQAAWDEWEKNRERRQAEWEKNRERIRKQGY